MQFDVVRLAMNRACELFGGRDGVFNSACFSQAFIRIAGVETNIDGRIVEAMLCGRQDVEQLSGGAHWRLIDQPKPKEAK